MLKTPVILCDLDNTLYDASERQKTYLLSGKKDFDGFHKAAKHDPPHWWCLQILQAMRNHGFKTIFTSGRDDTYRKETQEWLWQHLLWQDYDYKLFMRPAGDFTEDSTMKAQWYHELIHPHFEVLFAIDDRKRVAEMWRRLGITCLHCAEGAF